jgi:hypothetical protein
MTTAERFLVCAALGLMGCTALVGVEPLTAPEASTGTAVRAVDAGGASEAGPPEADKVSERDETSQRAPQPLGVFVSSKAYPGNFPDGVNGADQECTRLATGAGLTGTWKAWLSSLDSFVGQRLTASGPWATLTGNVVATSREQLLSGIILNPIDVDEHKVASAGLGVWTGVSFGGVPAQDCQNWSVENWFGFCPTGMTGRTGTTDFRWSSASEACCLGDARSAQRIYCFQNSR